MSVENNSTRSYGQSFVFPVAIAGVALYVIGVPLGALFLLRLHRRELNVGNMPSLRLVLDHNACFAVSWHLGDSDSRSVSHVPGKFRQQSIFISYDSRVISLRSDKGLSREP